MSKSKTFKTLSLTGAALAASAVFTVAHADDVDTPTVNTDAPTSQATDTQTTSLTQAEQNVAIASSDLNVATESVTNAEQTLAITETANTRAEVSVMKAEQTLDANTQEVAQATDMVKATTVEAGFADTAVDTAKEALNQAGGQDLADASNALSDANKTVSNAQEAQAKAQADVNAQETVVTRTNDERVNSETDLATAQDNVTTKTDEVASAKDALVNANQAIQDKEAQIKTTLADYDAKIKEAARSKETKVVTETRTIDPVTSYENETKDTRNDVASIILADGERQTTLNIPKDHVENDGGFTAINYTPNADAITSYLVDYINELRQINGIPYRVKAVTDPRAKAYVEARAKENADRQETGHETHLHAPQGVLIAEDAAGTFINPKVETFNGVYSDKQYAYQLMLGWTSEYLNLYPDNLFGHLESLLYSEGDIAFANAQQVAKYGDGQGKGYKEYQDVLHFVKADDGTMSNGYLEMLKLKTKDTGHGKAVFKDGKRIIGLPKETFVYNVEATVVSHDALQKLQEEYNNYQDQIKGERQALNQAFATASATLTTKTQELEDAKAAVTRAQQTVTDATSAYEKAETSLRLKKTILATANDNLAKALDAKEAAQKAFDQAQAANTVARDAKEAFDKAVAKAKDAHKALSDAKVALETANAKRPELKQNLQNAKYTLSMMQDHLERAKTQLVNARKDLATAQKAYDKAQTELALIKASTKPVETKPGEPTKPVEPTKPGEPAKPVEPTKPVEPAKPVEPTKPIETKPVETKPVETKPVETPAEKPAKFTFVKAGTTAASQKLGVTYNTAVESTKRLPQAPAVTQEDTTVALPVNYPQQGHKTLPETGDKGSIALTAAGIGVLAGLGLAGRKRRTEK